MARQKSPEGYINQKTWLVGQLRRVSYRWPARSAALKAARVDRGLYKCAACGNDKLKSTEIKLDHIKPIVPFEGFTTWDSYIERMFCAAEGFNALCAPCHDSKTAIETEMRKQFRLKKKAEDAKE